MLDNVFGIELNSGIQVACRHGAFLIFVSLALLLAIRLAMSLVSNTKVKARKQWEVEPAQDDNQSLIARLINGPEEEAASQYFLNDEVKRLLEQRANRAPLIDPEERKRPAS